MRRNKLYNVLSVILVAALCLGMVPVTGAPVVAAGAVKDESGREWIIRMDDFNDRTVGTDAFWNDSKYSAFNESYHSMEEQTGGTAQQPIYTTYKSSYDVIEEDGNKMLEMVSNYKVPTYFGTTMVSGAYSMSFDFYMPRSNGSSVPGLVVGLLEKMTPSLPGNILVYIDGNSQIRLVEGLTNGNATDNLTTVMKAADGRNMVAKLDTWFTIKLSVEPGKFMVKVWPRGEQEPADDSTAGVCVFEHASLTEEVLNRGMRGRIQTRNRNEVGVSYAVRIDNLKLAKPYESLQLPTKLYGDPGDTLQLEPTFVGQNLFAQQPVPQVKYTLSNAALADISKDGMLTLKGNGQGVISVELLDIDGKSTEAAHKITLTVGGAEPLRILSIGNSYNRDAFAYLSPLASLVGERVECAYLDLDEATLRMHARNAAKDAAEYRYYTGNAVTGEMELVAAESSIAAALEQHDWDLVVLQQNVEEAAIATTFTADLQYLLDLFGGYGTQCGCVLEYDLGQSGRHHGACRGF